MINKQKNRPRIDYTGFRLSRLGEPRFSHLKLLGGWIIYFALYFLTENLIPQAHCHVLHNRLDDLIPFTEAFVIPYVFWFFLVAGSLLFYILYDAELFRRLQCFIMVTQAVAMLVYIVWPNMQDLRPDPFPRANAFTWALSIIYAFDTPTGVCPSLHVAYSLGIASVFLKDPEVQRGWKVFIVCAVIVISAATAFVKQHSVVDIFWALPLGLLAEILVFGGWWRKWLAGNGRRAGA